MIGMGTRGRSALIRLNYGDSAFNYEEESWVPAFAGMTGGGGYA